MKSIKNNAQYIETTITNDNELMAKISDTSLNYKLPVPLPIVYNDNNLAIVGTTPIHPDFRDIEILGDEGTVKSLTVDPVGVFEEVNQLVASDVAEGDRFGYFTYLNKDGLRLFVGTVYNDEKGYNAGKVYEYKRNTVNDEWEEVTQITGSDITDTSYFGISISMSDDENTLVVGAHGDDTVNTDTGAVYTFKRDTVNDVWTEINKLTISDATEYDYFGISVSVSSDGLVLTVGAHGDDTVASAAGKVYTYKRATIDDEWTEVNQLVASDAVTYDLFGRGMILSRDGLFMVVSSYYRDSLGVDTGRLYTYERNNIDDDWILKQIIDPIYNLKNSNYNIDEATILGINLSMSDDMLKLIVGLNKGLAVYSRKTILEEWKLSYLHNPHNNISIGSISGNGMVVCGANNSYSTDTLLNIGIVYTYNVHWNNTDVMDINYHTDKVNQLVASDAEESDYFGVSNHISSDGLVLVVGAHTEDTAATNAGKVYTYKRDTIDDDWTEVNQLVASDAAENDYFGVSVSVSSDGLVLTVGAHGDDTAASAAGKVYTYKRDTIDDEWTEVNQLVASDAAENDNFGRSVSIAGDELILVVGAHNEDTAATNAGKVYTYKRATIDSNWVEVNQLMASDASDNDYFGAFTVLADGGLVLVVGAEFYNAIDDQINGKVYTYKRATIDDAWIEVNQLTASDAVDDDNDERYSRSIALVDSGLFMAVSAHFKDSDLADSGKVYFYKRENIDSEWIEVSTLLDIEPQENGRFGSSISLSSNGEILVVGSEAYDTIATNTGKIDTFKIEHDVWVYLGDEQLPITEKISNIYPDPDISVYLETNLSEDGTLGLPFKHYNSLKGTTNTSLTVAYDETTTDEILVDHNPIDVTVVEYQDTIYDSNPFNDIYASATYTFDGNTNDLLGNYDIEVINSGGYVDGKFHQAMNFDVDQCYAEIPYGAVGNMGVINDNGLTFGGTIKLNTYNDASTLVEYGMWANNVSFGLVNGVWSVKARISVDGGVFDTYITDNKTIPLDTFSTAYVVLDPKNNQIRLYVDGELVNQANHPGEFMSVGYSLTETGNNVGVIGSTYPFYAYDVRYTGLLDIREYRNFRGSIEQVRFFKRALNDEEVRLITNEKLPVLDIANLDLLREPRTVMRKEKYELPTLRNISDNSLDVIGIKDNELTLLNKGLFTTENKDKLNNVTYETLEYVDYPGFNRLELKNTLKDTNSEEYYGTGIDISEDGLSMVVGSRNNSDIIIDAGKVYTYKRATIDDDWIEVNQLVASDAEEYDNFGRTVTLDSTGTILVVGAYAEDTAGSGAGKVYTYKRDTIDDDWTEVNQLVASDAGDYKYYGRSVAVSADGLILVVSGYGTTTDYSGSDIYTYIRTNIDDDWTEIDHFIPDNNDDVRFGSEISLSTDGLILAIGSYGNDEDGIESGKAYVYERSNVDDAWTQVSVLESSGIEYGHFGRGIAISADGLYLLVTEPGSTADTRLYAKLYIYRRLTRDDDWELVTVHQHNNNQYSAGIGSSISYSSMSNTLIVSSEYYTIYPYKSGAVFTYHIPLVKDVKLSFDSLNYIPEKIYVTNEVTMLPILKKEYNETDIKVTFSTVYPEFKSLQRRILLSEKDIELTTGLYSLLWKTTDF